MATATVSDAQLTISIPDISKKKGHVKITCKVNFTPYELNEMKEGLVFDFRCGLYGLDLGGLVEHFISQLGSKHFTGQLTSPQSISYEKDIAFSLLDEDPPGDWFEDSLDELVGKCILTNTYTGREYSVRTNQIKYQFGS